MIRLLLPVTLAGVLCAQAPQAPNPTQQSGVVEQEVSNPVYRVTVVGRTVRAVNYRHRGGATKIDFEGTALLSKASGEAKVESKQGYIEIEVEFDELEPASKFGPEYLTYVAWAISPEGRATNLGEVILNGNRSKLNVTTELQSFGMIVTAEPYFAVTQPSNVVVMENAIRADTQGKYDVVDAKYELLERGQYTMVNSKGYQPVRGDQNTPLDLLEARNAIQIARLSGADKYAGDTYTKAANLLQQAENYQTRKAGRRPVSMTSREAVQTAEDARIITLKRIEEERLANERRASADRETAARAAAAEQARQRAAAEEQQRLEAQRRAQAEADSRAAQAQQQAADAQRLAAEKAKAEAEAATQRAMQERAAAEAATAEAERARQAALAQQQALAAEADRARQAAASAEADKQRLRKQLLDQLNLILETRDTARGLIVNLSDVLFDTGKSTLRAGAREKLAKVSGIVLAYPGLRLEAEGHTDSVGSDDYNQKLSEARAASVRDYLTQQGVPGSSLSARGLGETSPVASNDNAAGRQQNRRVEIVVSGEVIGTQFSEVRGTATQQVPGTTPAPPQQ